MNCSAWFKAWIINNILWRRTNLNNLKATSFKPRFLAQMLKVQLGFLSQPQDLEGDISYARLYKAKFPEI